MKSSLFIEKVLGNAERNWWASKATKFIKPSSYDKKEISTQKLGTSHFVLNSSGKIYEHNSIPKHVFTKYRSSKKNRKFGLFFYLFSGLPTLPPIFLLFRIQQTAIANSKFHKIQLTEKQKNRKSYFKF